jgi:hypothetical protein
MVEEESSRSRERDVAIKVLNDQIMFLKRERDEIEKSLIKRIEMDKKIIAEMGKRARIASVLFS